MKYLESRTKDKIRLLVITSLVFFTGAVLMLATIISHAKAVSNSKNISIELPDTYDKTYEENANDYQELQAMAESDWDALTLEDEKFLTVTVSSTVIGAHFEGTPCINASSRTLDDETLISMSENDAWSFISNGLFKKYPDGNFSSNQSTLSAIKATNTETIKVPCWYWCNPDDTTDMSKTTVYKTFAVNTSIAQLFEHIFTDIYNDASQPVLNLADTGMGTWVLRGKNNNPNNGLSSHALGCAIDINPSTGSFKVNGDWYGNGYGQKTMSSSIWNELPECHEKYQVMYAGSPIVEIFKSYGFVWGGDWSGNKDCMHFSFIGDGKTCRSTGLQNYLDRK